MKIGAFLLRVIMKGVGKMDAKKRDHWPRFNAYRHVFNIDALGDGEYLHGFDVYYAPEEIRNGIVLIDIHGGAYIYGDRKNNFGYASVFLAKGYDVVTLDYEHNDGKTIGVERQVETLCRQLAYLHNHAKELGLDPEKFCLLGDSAGGHFALLLAQLSLSPELREKLGVDLGGIRIHGVAVSCPVYDFKRALNTPMLSRSGRRAMFGPNFESEQLGDLYSPKTHAKLLTIPVFLTSCFNDFLNQDSLDLEADAKRIGMNLRFSFVENQDRSVGHVFNVIDFHLPDAIRVNDETDEFIKNCF